MSIFKLNYGVSSRHCQVVETYIRLVATAKSYSLIFRRHHVNYFISCVLLQSLKNYIRLVRFMKLNELERFALNNYFIWKLLLAQFTFESWKYVGWNESVLVAGYFVLQPSSQAIKVYVLAWSFASAWRNQAFSIIHQANPTSLNSWGNILWGRVIYGKRVERFREWRIKSLALVSLNNS